MTIVGSEIREFPTSETLLENLLHEGVWGEWPWKYRGQGNKDHELVPSALRPNTKFFSVDEQPAQSNKIQIIREWTVLKRFATFADHQGLPLPGSDALFNELTELNWFVNKCAQSEHPWPPKRLYGLMALAQHYGVPTRMLDWTRAPLIGLYFAACYAAQEDTENSQITLYALNESIFNMYVFAFGEKYESHMSNVNATLIGIDVPYAGNPNITAQSGTFTCIRERRLNPERAVSVEKLEHTVVELAETLNQLDDEAARQAIQTAPLLIKLVAPGHDAGRLLRKLASTFHVMAATVFPGFRGAAMTVRERQLWDKKWSDEKQLVEAESLAALHELKLKKP